MRFASIHASDGLTAHVTDHAAIAVSDEHRERPAAPRTGARARGAAMSAAATTAPDAMRMPISVDVVAPEAAGRRRRSRATAHSAAGGAA